MADVSSPRRSRPTMNDVAAHAGVSLKTVSRVVNGLDHVSADKFERVTRSIETLGFRRNEYARQLRQGTTATIGLVLEDVADPFYSLLTRAVEDVAFERNHVVLAASSAEDPLRARALIESFGARGVDGLIVAPAGGIDARYQQSELDSGSSMVFVDRPVSGIDADTVLVDSREGAQRGTEHLIRHGHRRIAFFGDDESVYTATERRAGYRAALEAAGIPFDERLVVMTVPATAPTSELLDRVLAVPDAPTALFGGNNRWSVRLLRALRDRSDRLAFLGFDDFELSDVLTPGITVIAQDASAVGRIAAELLFRRITGDTSPVQRVQLATRLIPRGSAELPGPFADR
jgi:LacI family transcriptional regulator